MSRTVALSWVLAGCAGPTDLVLPDPLPRGSETSASSGNDPDDGDGPNDGNGPNDPDEPEPTDPREVIERELPPPPIYGGTLLVLDDGATVVVADPDRGLVHITDVSLSAGATAIDVGIPSEPWRMAQTTDGHVHVVARGSGELLTIDPTTASLLERRAVCRHPRGIAADGERVVLACASGALWSLATSDATPEILPLDPDLRDVFFDTEGVLHVTRFRSAEVLSVASEGQAIARWQPTVRIDEHDEPWKTSTAWRSIPLQDGWLMLHQLANDRRIDVENSLAYGRASTCGAAVHTNITMRDRNGGLRTIGHITDTALAVDVAIDETRGRIALAVASGCGPACTSTQLALLDVTALSEDEEIGCITPTLHRFGDGDAQMTSVAYAPDGTLLVQQRDPSGLYAIAADGTTQSLDLGGDSVEDTGHRLFHETAAAPVACASCHPEGGDDGQVWWLGERRHTQSLDVGLSGTAPFHWLGDLEDFAALVSEVHRRRMGALPLDDDQLAAFERWVGHRQLAPSRTADDTTLAGKLAWTRYGCETCHVHAVADGSSVLLDGDLVPLQVPPLHGVALHPPWMHDGRSLALTDAVREMIVRTVPGATPTPDEIAALAAYLETL